MTRSVLLLAHFLLAAGFASAQTGLGTGETGGPMPPPKALNEANLRSMYEDVTILGVLLNRSLERAVGLPGLLRDHHGMPHDPHSLGGVDGVYVRGHGVVYTLRLPTTTTLLTGGTSTQATPLTPWQMTKKELTGEKPETSTTTARKTSITETVLKVLAENGQHFTHLGDNEQITVAITLRHDLNCLICHASAFRSTPLTPSQKLFYPGTGTGGMSGTLGLSGLQSSAQSKSGVYPGVFLSPGGQGTSQTQPPKPPGDKKPSETLKALSPDLQNQMLLAELHFKQGQYETAYKEYAKAMQLHNASFDAKQANTAGDLYKLMISVELYNALARISLHIDRKDEAAKLLLLAKTHADLAADLAKRLETKTPQATATIPLPSKLIITASKKSLVAVGNGKMNFEEFSKQATVEYLNFGKQEAPKTPMK